VNCRHRFNILPIGRVRDQQCSAQGYMVFDHERPGRCECRKRRWRMDHTGRSRRQRELIQRPRFII
jgi:hypothetical protein